MLLSSKEFMYFVYILKCADKTLYTGITVDLKRRLKEHNSSSLGAKYTRTRRPVVLVYNKKFRNRSLASKEENWIKGLGRGEKLVLIKGVKQKSQRTPPNFPRSLGLRKNKKE